VRCNTCEKTVVNKNGKYEKCKVLSEMIGLKKDCFAWTNDPRWEEKVNQAVKEYALGKHVSSRAS